MCSSTTDKLLKVREVAQILNTTPRTVWRLVSMGSLPQPVRISRRLVRWRADDIQRFIDARAQTETRGHGDHD